MPRINSLPAKVIAQIHQAFFYLRFLIPAVIVLSMAACVPPPPGTDVNGNITQSTTWTIAGSPYRINQTIQISSGVTLTIQPGVSIRFTGNYALIANGTLNAQGTPEARINFYSSSATPAAGNWQYIQLNNSSSIIDNAIISYANRGVYVPSFFQSPTIRNSLMASNNTGIYFEPGTSPIINHNVIIGNTDGIFAGCNVYTGCNPQINNNSIYNNTAYNLRAFSYGEPAPLVTINAENNWWGSTDINVIEGTILHYQDTAILAHVDFIPYLDGPNGNSISPIPPAPQLNTATGLNFSVNLTWSPAQNAAGYKVHYGTSSANYATTIDAGNVFNYTVPGLIPNIPYYFVISAYSVNGDGPNSNELSATPANLIFITDNSVTNRFLDPKGSQTSTINYTLSKNADVTIKIYDWDTQTLVHTLINNQPRLTGANTEIFDGKNDLSQVLPPDVYIYKITVSDNQGGIGSYDPIFSGGLGPVFSNVNLTPASNFSSFKGDRLQVNYNLQAPGLVSLGVGGQPDFLARQPRDTTNNVDTWDGRGANGNIVTTANPQELQAKTEKLPENFIVIKDNVTLDVTVLKSDPYVIRPLYSEATQITYTINEAADVTVRIISPDGVQILKTLEESIPKSAGTYNLTWDGKTTTGETVAVEGDYRIRVHAVSPTGDTVVRDGNIKILF